jgi:ribosome assembly protein YihI (activator of Der GTPase)
MPKRRKNGKKMKKMKRVREKAPLAIPEVNFKGKERKKLTKRKKNEKGSRKSSFWQFPKS